MTVRRPGASLAGALLLAALALPAAPLQAQIGDTTYRLADPAQEERAREIGRGLRCLVCQNQSIEDSDAGLARDLRKLVREQIEQGASNQEVVRFVHERYGDFVLLKPPFSIATALLWATPALALLAGGLTVWRLRRSHAGLGDTELTEAERQRLAQIGSDPPA
ncbi:MAG: cytochrome c-type biogenesis protein CcmH [Rubritepida sp.]|jgi:cytochrome c-type biogenesis protein CcmH|nr:cytochrome c-type biogenesis protein CcmH [Rubritepida sp.]MCU0945723.1 cytochrome c-type biogenesis protein CcmH [Rubritepida sp.]